MKISDLNYIEEVTEASSVVGGILNVLSPQGIMTMLGQSAIGPASTTGGGGINLGSPAISIPINIAVVVPVIVG